MSPIGLPAESSDFSLYIALPRPEADVASATIELISTRQRMRQ
jgi:hypothetical protein